MTRTANRSFARRALAAAARFTRIGAGGLDLGSWAGAPARRRPQPGGARVARWLALLPLVPLSLAAQGTYVYSITPNSPPMAVILQYIGSDTVLTVPATINGLPVGVIGPNAFADALSLASVTLPNTVLSIETNAFEWCVNLTNIDLGDSVTNIEDGALSVAGLTSLTLPNSLLSVGTGTFEFDPALARVTFGDRLVILEDYAFSGDTNLTSVVLPSTLAYLGVAAFQGCGLVNVTLDDGLTNLGQYAFQGCAGLASLTIPASVTSIEGYAFQGCSKLTALYFEGNEPSVDQFAFWGDNLTAYYLAGTTGWGATLAGQPTAVWSQPTQVTLSMANAGVRTNQFGFTVTGTLNAVFVVEAASSLANPAWSPLQTNTLTGGSFYFSDPQWKNYSTRFYRLTAQ